jgi:hypothetical protein
VNRGTVGLLGAILSLFVGMGAIAASVVLNDRRIALANAGVIPIQGPYPGSEMLPVVAVLAFFGFLLFLFAGWE